MPTGYDANSLSRPTPQGWMKNYNRAGDIVNTASESKYSGELPKFADDAIQGMDDNQFRKWAAKQASKKAGFISPELFSLLGKALAVAGAGQAGWGIGRTLGNTPLMTDPSMTYDQFYQQQFQNLFNKVPW
jgi:hypothetical protein